MPKDMSKKKEKQSSSIYKNKSSSSWMHKHFLRAQKDESSTAYRLYESCSDLPLTLMKECLCFENYKALVIEGNPDETIIQDKWLSIYSEFVTLSHETDVLSVKSLRASIIVLEARLAKVSVCVNTLAAFGPLWDIYENSDEHIEVFDLCVDTLRKLNFRYKFDPFGSTYYEDLAMITTRSKEWEIHLELKQTELESIEAKNKGEKVPPTYFTTVLMRMSQHFKFMITEKSLMTAEYCIMKRDFVNEVNKINATNNARKR